jgi:hypothetical protein
MCYNPDGNNTNLHYCEIPKFLSTIFCSFLEYLYEILEQERKAVRYKKQSHDNPSPKRKDGIYDDYY